MKKIIIASVLIGVLWFTQFRYIEPDKTYTMICNDKIIDINFAQNTKKILYDSSKINTLKPLFDIGINYCKIDNILYISAGVVFKYSLIDKKLTKTSINGHLLTCIKDKKVIFYKKENKLYKYMINNKMSKFIFDMRDSNKNWLDFDRGVAIVNNQLFFNDKSVLYRYDLNTEEVIKSTIKYCNVVQNANIKDKLLCSNRAYAKEKKSYFIVDFKTHKKEYIDLPDIKNVFYDNELDGIFYTRYDWDFVHMKEYRPSFFYNIKNHTEYRFSKDCHF